MDEQFTEASHGQMSNTEENISTMAAIQKPYTVLATGLSHIGLVRQNNEDVWASVPEIGLYILADGMGGHQAGEVAARETVNQLARVIKKKIASLHPQSLSDVRDFVRRAVIHVNALIYKMGRSKSQLRGMGTTLCCLLFHPKGLVLAHVGDSRIYRLRGSKLDQLTKDHSLLRELVDQGQLTEEQINDFLYKNIITKAMGTESKVDPAVETKRVHEGDIYMMCSDGLSDLLSPEEMIKILTSSKSIDQAAERFIITANQKGGRDNITVLITKIQPALDD